MKNIIYLLFISFTVSCVSNQGIVAIQYKSNKTEVSKKNVTYSMTIPKGYDIITLVGGHNELEKHYIYPDSSKIYISDFGNSVLNYENILSLGDTIAKKRFEGLELKTKIAKEYKPETLTLQGKAINGLYWKDLRVTNLSIGYVNVPESRKSEFDKALSSFFKK